MYILLGIHMIAFLSKLRIYKIEAPKQKGDKDDEFYNAEGQPALSDKKVENDGTILPSH